MNYYLNKVVLITGASSGIGEAIALEMAAAKAVLILAARRMEELQRVANACRLLGAKDVLCVELDVTNRDQVRRLGEEIDKHDWKIDILINNAGISQRSLVMETSEDVERRIMEVNYFAPVHLSKVMYPRLQKNGQIVIISSLSGLFGFMERSTYAASKHAIKGYFESWQLEKPDIAITMIFPGRIQSNISFHALHGDGSRHSVLDKAQQEGMPAKLCAQKVLRTVAKRKKIVLIGRKELILYAFYKYCPPLFYKITASLKANG